MRKIITDIWEDDEHGEVRPEDVKVGALFNLKGALAGLLIVLSERELDALRNGGVVHHAAPSCLDETQAQPVAIVLCSVRDVVLARQMIETICAASLDEGEVRH